MFGMSTNELGGVRTELDENHYKRKAKTVEGSIYWALTEGKDERHRNNRTKDSSRILV